jgi:hypothetical protein
MNDYFIFRWLQFSKHFDGCKFWAWEFHWKGSDIWYHNFKRSRNLGGICFNRTRLTLRLGKYIIVISDFIYVDMEAYYKGVALLKVVDKGKVVFSRKTIQAVHG